MRTPSQLGMIAALSICGLCSTPATAADETIHPVGIYCDTQDAVWQTTADTLVGLLGQSKYDVVRLTAAQVTDAEVLDPTRFDLVIVADAARVPGASLNVFTRFVHNGGNLMLLGGPFFESTLWPYGDRNLTRSELVEAVAQEVHPTLFLEFDSDNLGTWGHATENRAAPMGMKRVSPGADDTSGALQLTLSPGSGWDTYASPEIDKPFPPGNELTTFRARAEQDNTQLLVEWRETDRSRWIAVVTLSTKWQSYVLPPEAFRYWHDSHAKGRGGPGDRFHPERAASITLGQALTHTPAMASDETRTVWVDQFGAATTPPELTDPKHLLPSSLAMPVLETVSPPYKLYPVTNLARLRVAPEQVIAMEIPLPLPAATMAPHRRPRGSGLDKGRRWRFLPLIDCLDADNRVTGSAAWLLLFNRSVVADSPQGGGLILGMPVCDRAFFGTERVRAWIGKLVTRVLRGPILYEGGAAGYASFGGEDMPTGAVVTNRDERAVSVDVETAVRNPARQIVWKHHWDIDIEPESSRRVASDWPIPYDAQGPYSVTVTMQQDGRLLDRLEHEVQVWRPKPNPQFMTIRDGDFYLGDEKWYAHGVNYMPRSGVAIEEHPYFEYWLDARPYDPVIIERDLADLEAIGLNCVSAFIYHRSIPSRNLLDFLMRCERHSLKVNLSLRPGTPMDFRWDEMREIIETYRLAENDTIMAYDIAWEPMWRQRPQRSRFDPLWREWATQKYGSLDAAEAAWEFKAPREGNRWIGPLDTHVSGDGPWRKMAIDYRRFLNDLLHDRYSAARALIKSVDPNHLVSFRMTIAGDPTVNQARMAYDPLGVAQAVDIMEPEGYGRIGDWDRVRPGWFTTAYCRAVAPDLPVLWAEFGTSIWDRASAGPREERLSFAADFYEDFYRMAYQSGSNGTICWYSPGGYRFNEKSDYGITNPDRSWRELTHVIHSWTERMTAPRADRKTDIVIPIRLNEHANGVKGIYEEVQQRFWGAIDSGKTPGLVVEK
ncbi:MAG: beta-galactosidase [Planctomycetes bacterium]|nr:beta-galactosidase [Planctomycetota bacterium]